MLHIDETLSRAIGDGQWVGSGPSCVVQKKSPARHGTHSRCQRVSLEGASAAYSTHGSEGHIGKVGSNADSGHIPLKAKFSRQTLIPYLPKYLMLSTARLVVLQYVLCQLPRQIPY